MDHDPNSIAWSLSATLPGALLLRIARLTHAAARNATERYIRVPARAHGIDKRYMGRDVAGVMCWLGAAWPEDEERERGSLSRIRQ